MQLYDLGIERFLERPWLGWGLRTIPVLVATAGLDMGGASHVHLHSAYLDSLVGIGLIGSALLLTLLLLPVRELILARRHGVVPIATFWAVIGCLVIVLVANLFDSMLWRFEHSRAPLELLFGCCIAYALIRRRDALQAIDQSAIGTGSVPNRWAQSG